MGEMGGWTRLLREHPLGAVVAEEPYTVAALEAQPQQRRSYREHTLMERVVRMPRIRTVLTAWEESTCAKARARAEAMDGREEGFVHCTYAERLVLRDELALRGERRAADRREGHALAR